MTPHHLMDTLLAAFGRRLLELIFPRSSGLRPDAPGAPPGATPAALVDALLPARVGRWPRVFVSDRFGGPNQGGVFASYTVDGHEVRVLVRRAASEAEAQRYVAEAPAGPGRRAWRDGLTWFSASGGSVLGDEDPTFAAGDVEAFDEFLRAWSLRGGGAPAAPSGTLALALLASCSLLAAGATLASASQASQEPQAFEVPLQVIGDGKAAFHERTATPTGDTLVVTDLDMTRPVFIGVEPVDPGVRLDVALYKIGEREPARRGQPDADGAVIFAFRTYDEVGIEVKAAETAAYRIAVLVAPPIEDEIPTPFVAPASTPGMKAALMDWAWPGVSILALVLGAAAFFRARRRSVAAPLIGLVVTAAACATWPVLLKAGGQPYSPDRSNPAIEFRRQLMQQVGGRHVPALANEQRVLREQAARDEERFKSIEGRLDKVKNMAESFEKWGGLVQKLVAAMEAVGRADRLSQGDLAYEPNYAPPGMPRVPSFCADSDKAGCRQCFAPAYDQLSQVRKKLENNRIVLANFTRRMNAIEDAGRGLGGMHGGLGIVFMKHKVEWDQQRSQIAGFYDQRYAALLIELQSALRSAEACEAEFGGTPDWYERFGFMYYEFMVARYKRTGNYGF